MNNTNSNEVRIANNLGLIKEELKHIREVLEKIEKNMQPDTSKK